MNRSTISCHKVDLHNEHLDIFFETPTHLETYETSCEKFAQLLDQKKIFCSKKKPHRKLYLDYEGEVSENRGFLKILWKGYLLNDEGIFPEDVNVCLIENTKLRLEF